jgi:hypothetical protein
MILQDHELEAYRRLGTALHTEYQPQTEIESQLVQRIVDCFARLSRAAAIDFNLMNMDLANVDLAENTEEAANDAVDDNFLAHARAWVRHSGSFEKLGRYEGRISRQLIQYRRELDSIQTLRKSQPVPEPNPSETADSKTTKDALASFRRLHSPDWLPRFMTAAAVESDMHAPLIPPIRATDSPTQPSLSNSGGN